MPRHKINFVCLFAILAIAAGGSLTLQAQTPDFSEPWVDEPVETFETFDSGYGVVPIPLFSVTGELLWLNRTDADGDQAIVNGTLTETINNVLFVRNETLIAMGDLNLPTEAGIRFSILLGPPTGRYFEFTYSGIFDQDATVTVNPNAAIQTDTGFFGSGYSLIQPPAPAPATIFQHTASYESDFHSLEMNVWSDAEWWRLRPFVGLRWIRQTDAFRVFENQDPGFGGQADFSNNLFGGQFGVATVLWQRADWFHVQATSKAGAYHNNMDLDAVFNFGGVPVGTVTRDENRVSCSGQIDITAVWQLTPYMNFHVGYTGLWLTEVGMAGDQNDNFDILTNTGNVDLGSITYQGGHLGVTLNW
jgi:hypothetical protein